MKKLLLLFTLLSSLMALSQAQYFVGPYASTGGFFTKGFAVKDNYLYFGCDGIGIRKINLNGPPSQTPIVVFTGVTNVQSLLFNGNDLYICEYSPGKISKIDVSLPNPILVDVLVSGLSAPTGMQIYNNYLYISEAYNYCVSRININQTNPVKEVVVAANGPWQIQLYGNELYVAENVGNKISKFNLLAENPSLVPVIEQINSPFGMYIEGNILYYDYFISTNVPKLSKINLTLPNPVSEPINSNGIENVGPNSSLMVHNNYIYRGGVYSSIQRFSTNTLSNSDELVYENSNRFYPNPATNQITFNESTKTVAIYTLDGKSIPAQLENNKVDVSHLSSGIYIVQITDENGNFVKQKLIKD